MRAIKITNIIFVFVFVVFWIEQVIGYWCAGDIIMSENAEQNLFFLIVASIAVLAIFLYMMVSHRKNKIIIATAAMILAFSVLTFFVLGDNLYFYFPWVHNEKAIIDEYFLFYFTITSSIWAIGQGIYFCIR